MMLRTRRAWLWALLLLLIAVALGSLIWLVGRYEQARFEDQLELSAGDLSNSIRAKLVRNAQRLMVLTERETPNWNWTARQLLEQSPEILRIERRDAALRTEVSINSPFLKQVLPTGIFNYFGRHNFYSEVTHACALAARSLEPAYSVNYFVPQGNGRGYEVTDMCLPRVEGDKITGYLIATYALDGILTEWAKAIARRQEEVSFVDASGARLAAVGAAEHNGNRFTTQAILNLSGVAFILRMDSWRRSPYWLTNTPTVLVLLLVVALSAVLGLLYRDTRKRLRTEARLAREIVQQRKTEELSRQSLERLQKSARLATLGEIASMLSHEINQPLAAIASYASGSLNLLEAKSTEADSLGNAEKQQQIKQALEHITAQSERAGLVIKSVHDFARRRETERAAVPAQALIDDVLPLLQLQAKQLGVQLETHIAADLPSVWCDKTWVEQVIINLARNGMQAMGMHTMGTQTLGNAKQTVTPPHQRILTISAQTTQTGALTQVEFTIQDQGPGLSPEVAEKLFTPFFTTKSEGMGLGLSLCRTVIEQHGGRLIYTTQTEPPHTRTTFSFKLMTSHATPA
ncbi:MAG: ATP-binding protein [Cytophagales bacterium]|nr:ATP-binding protein [Cytophagales bacterium]